MSQGSMSSHSSQSATSKAPVVAVDTGSSFSQDLQPARPSLGVSSRTRSRRNLVVKELNWTTSESSKADGTSGLPLDPAAEALEGSPEEAEREVEASVEVIEPPAVVLAYMAANIPRFIKRSTKYEDLFGEASDSQAPLPVKPLSQLPSPSLEQKKTSSGGRKRDPSKTAEAGSSAEGRTSKKPRLTLARSSPASSSSQKTQLFQRMLSDQVPEATVREWDRLSIAEATRDKVVANAKSLFLDLKMGEHVADTARVNEKMRADLKQAKADLASAVKDRDLVRKANQELKEAEAKVREERRKEDAVRRSLEEETDGLGKMVKRLEGQVKELQEAAVAAKATRKEREAAVFEAGVAAGVKDCVKSAYHFFPDNDWAKLGPDAAVALEEAKAEDASGQEKVPTTSQGFSGDGIEKRGVAEDEPKPVELISAGTEVTPPEGVPATTLATTQAPQDILPADEKGSSSPAS
ncbi:uncharacterized protein LOC135151422 [Daucus carota subsp. sativus]|uniref:uncharacterized protein LOC135151422 n=1 Tax=Daucus carota subsp. sativus TaxID=79200 RepID=UPI0030833497